jgi:hypothetical protein
LLPEGPNNPFPTVERLAIASLMMVVDVKLVYNINKPASAYLLRQHHPFNTSSFVGGR